MDYSENSSSDDQKPLLTFNALYNILRTEKKQQPLQKFPQHFYEALEEFIENKKSDVQKAKKENDLQKAKKEQHVVKNSTSISKELIALRTQKIAKIAAQNTLFEEEVLEKDNILEKEKDLYDSMSKNIKKLQTLKK